MNTWKSISENRFCLHALVNLSNVPRGTFFYLWKISGVQKLDVPRGTSKIRVVI